MLSALQAVEMFHLVFLRALAAKGTDKSRFVLKGGCNLRFYFHSVRHSEDVDIDVAAVAKNTLTNKVERLLQSPMTVGPMRTAGIEIVDTLAPKQTETSQRWKIGLRVPGRSEVVRTKIEFSRREAVVGAAFESIDAEVGRAYSIAPFLATHYLAPRAVIQKTHALFDRRQPQARDVFDLNHLFARPDTHRIALSAKERSWLPLAIERAMDLSFDQYASQVVAFLDPDQRDLFAGRVAWDAMQEAVVNRLGQLA